MCSSGWGPSGPFGPAMPRGLGYKPGPPFGDPATIYPPGVYKVSEFHWWVGGVVQVPLAVGLKLSTGKK